MALLDEVIEEEEAATKEDFVWTTHCHGYGGDFDSLDFPRKPPPVPRSRTSD